MLLLLLLSCFSHVRLCATPWTAAHQAPQSTEFSRQEYWSGLPFPSPISQCIWTNIYRHRTIIKIQNISITLKSSLLVSLPSVLIPGPSSWLPLICSLSYWFDFLKWYYRCCCITCNLLCLASLSMIILKFLNFVLCIGW